jgi:hypothetical protein
MENKNLKTYFLLILMFLAGVNIANAQLKWNQNHNEERISVDSKLNNKRFEQNLEKYKVELELTKKQTKQLSKIDKRYNRLGNKVSRKGGTRKDKKQLSDHKREEMIEVLSAKQQQKLQDLSRKGIFSIENLFGK